MRLIGLRIGRSRPAFIIAVACCLLVGPAPLARGAVNLTPLGSGGGSFNYSDGQDISSDGTVVVGATNTPNGTKAFRWTQAGGMTLLGDLPGAPANGTHAALGVSADGSVIVGQGTTLTGKPAFRWTAATGMVSIGDLPGGPIAATARAVSDDGLTIVGVGNEASFDEAFIWTEVGGMKRLWSVLFDAGVNPAADGWTQLVRADGISADGTRIVGSGYRNGFQEAFLVVVPEPSSLAIGGLLALSLCRRRRRASSL